MSVSLRETRGYVNRLIFTGNGDLFTRERERSDSQKGGCESNQGVVRSSEVVVCRTFKYVD